MIDLDNNPPVGYCSVMATFFTQDGFAFRIYPRDHEPPHVHAIARGKGEVKIELFGPEGIPRAVRLTA